MNNSWSSEAAIKMFNDRLKALEQEKANISDDEKEALKTPSALKSEEQLNYIKKLKNTLKVYKARSKEFEKRR